jgi:predicted lactoylglutathione lyase
VPQQIYINLPVKDLARARAFYSALGFTLNPQFSNDDAICMVVSDTIYLMLLTEPFFAGFTGKPIADATKTTEVLLCLSRDSREAVDEMVAKARAAGGTVRARRRTTATCTATASKTRTATSGNCRSWT